MRAIALLALTGCTQIFGLADPVQREPADAAAIDMPVADVARDAPPPGSCDPTETALIACFDFEGSVEDRSSVGHVVTAVVNVDFTGASGPDGKFARIGLSSAMTIAASTSFNTDEYTIAAWVRFSTLPAGGGSRVGVFDAESRYSIFISSTGSIVTRGTSSTANSVGVGAWTHVAVTDNGSTISFYINGALVTATQINTPVPTSNAGAEIGGNAPTGDRMDGAIDALRVYSRVLSGNEIAALAAP